MPRVARIDTPGLLQHIVIRGIERRRIFDDDRDRENFLDRLSILIPETKTNCYAWAFMTNHAHFLMKSGPTGITPLMRRLLTGYAVVYNRRHKRHGPLFQNRFKSIICQEDSYFKELVRYIHLNPLRAGVVSDLEALDTYAFCGHGTLIGKKKRDWQEVEYVLGYFGKRIPDARRKYRSHMEKGLDQGRRPELVGGGLIRSLGGWDAVKKIRRRGRERIKSDQRILGEGGFVDEVLSESVEQFSRKYKLQRKGFDFDAVVERVSVIFQLDKSYITGRGRQRDRVAARDLLCHWSAAELRVPIVDIARKLDLTPGAVSFAVQRGEKIAKAGGFRLDKSDI